MIPKTVSASALKVASLCMARYKAEYIDGGRDISGEAADFGTTLHLALEKYVEAAIREKKSAPTVETLMSCFMMAYLTVMKDHNFESEIFKEGERLLRVWHARNNFDEITVLSCESKSFFMVPYMLNGVKQEIKFNYICDRVDQISETEIRVVDYKSWRNLITPEDVKSDLQARCYALAYQILFPKATRIWVIIDQLRGEEVGACFTRDDNIITWKSLKMIVQGIIDYPDDFIVKESLNDECRWCVRKSKCQALRKHHDVGGVLDMNLDDMMEKHYAAKVQIATLKKFLESLEPQIRTEMDELGLTTLESLDKEYVLNTGGVRGGRRAIPAHLLPQIVGVDVALGIAEYGIGKVDSLKGDPRVDAETFRKVEDAIVTFPGKRQVNVTKKKKKPQGDSDA
ncbi:PD-(D/E)XK nuclease family protein [Streptomyces wedmorensis]|uniref:RecB family exonuclease n=1 Tax=Streptomyces wedmorensis TaxID=43759 RepID=UPI003426DA1C